MQVDYSYIETIFRIIEEGLDIHELENNEGFQTVIDHAQLTGNEFSIKNVEDAIKGVNDNAYGLRNLLNNIERIKDLYELFKEQEDKWLKEVVKHIEKLFVDANHKVTKIYPVIGYDIGIGLNNKVCINLNSEILLQDYRELISIIIHESSHTYYESIHGSILELLKIKTPMDMKNLLNSAIQYEGVGIFSAEEYRTVNNLPKTGSPIREDYNISINDKSYMELFEEYKKLARDLINGDIKDSEEFMSRCFGELKLTHRLGYSIFSEINRKRGIRGVRDAIKMSNENFAEEFL